MTQCSTPIGSNPNDDHLQDQRCRQCEHVLDALLQRRLRASPHEMFMSPLAVAIALPRLIHDRDERALQRHRIAEYLFLTGALQ